LVRNSYKGALVAAAYPKIRLVYGTLEDTTLLEEESARADIVLREYAYFWSFLNTDVLYI
jgi:hypothetical protein